MTAISMPVDTIAEPRPARRRRPVGLTVAIAFLAVALLAAIFAPLVAPHDPIAQNLGLRNAGPSWSHILGTDRFGRDVVSRLIWGGRNAFGGVAIAISVAVILGIPWGTIAGFWPRRTGTILMRVADVLLAFPTLVLAVAITGSLGVGLVTSMISVGLVLSPNTAQLTRTGVLALRNREFVLSARLSGVRTGTVLVRHVLPLALGPVVIQITIYTGLAFVIQGALAFLGLGPQRPTPSWGSDLADAYGEILVNPWQILPAGVLLGLIVLSVYRCGDALRDRMSAPKEPS
ncbi:ABC transporter permease [Desertimonas flava]|uniref:ABC transporter permease n=1 Tax=Desertimonas flava TaxID=2064846 RepID=UPI000E34B930|nr:ABC transporter permease [Desertimonas flava]